MPSKPSIPTKNDGDLVYHTEINALVNHHELKTDQTDFVAHVGSNGAAHGNAVAAGASGFMTGADKTKLDGVATNANLYVHPANHAASIISQDVNNRFVTDAEKVTWNGKINTSLKGAINGVAELDGTGKVPASQLPSYVDDVVMVATFVALPSTGETGKIYVVEATNVSYRWNGSSYTEISSSLALGTTSGSAHRGDHGSTAYTHSQVVIGNPHNVTKADVGLSLAENTADIDKVISNPTQAALNLKAALSGTVGFAVHGSDAGYARPNYGCVIWFGSVNPTNSTNNDPWFEI